MFRERRTLQIRGHDQQIASAITVAIYYQSDFWLSRCKFAICEVFTKQKQIEGARQGLPQTAHITSCNKIKNPNPFPMGNKFGFLKYGGDYGTRTCDLLRVKQAL